MPGFLTGGLDVFKMKLQKENLNKTTAQAFAYWNSPGSGCYSGGVKCLLCLK